MNHWIRPSCDSRTGASHLRRGVPCQDASGSLGFRDAAGSPIQVLVVSDGHGGARYVRSDVGARLACSVAMRELQQALAPARVDHPGALEEWRAWLSAELPGRIVGAWRREVEAHWRADPAADGSGFSPLLYGATLGVLLLTPAWWAHTGLGDWDLVRIEVAGGEALLSEEAEREAGGEATFSLCLERAERHFAARTRLQPLTAEQAPFALLLCSDGLRKSCGSDRDFLTLSRYLVELPAAVDPAGSTELAEALDHISRQGSGDDISVAVARWAPIDQAAAWPPCGRAVVGLIQPAPDDAPSALMPAVAPMPAGAAASAVQAPAGGTAQAGAAGAADGSADGGSLAAFQPGVPSAAALTPSQPHRSGSRPSRRRSGRRLALGAAVLALGGGALLLALGRGLGPFAARPQPRPLELTPPQRSDLRRQVQDLCEPSAARAAAPVRAGGPPATGAVASRPRQPDPGGGPPGAPPSGAPPDAAPESRAGSEIALPATDAQPTASPATLPGAAAATPLDPRRQQRIAATLASRASVFQRLRHGDPAQVAPLLARSHADPLSALIAFSISEPDLRPAPAAGDPPGPLQQLGRQLAALRPAGSAPRQGSSVASPLTALGACPELRQALRDGWQRLTAADAAPGPTQALPSVAPPERGKAPRGVGTGLAPAIRGPSPGPATRSL